MALVVLLRGVNVGGNRTFRPKALATAMGELDVVNIGAAGTFVVRGRVTQRRAREELARRLPFVTDVAICDGREFLRVIAAHRPSPSAMRPGFVPFVSVLTRTPRLTPSLPLFLPTPEDWLLTIEAQERRYVFGAYQRHMKAIGALGRIDTLFGVPLTTRTWGTIESIVRVLEGTSA